MKKSSRVRKDLEFGIIWGGVEGGEAGDAVAGGVLSPPVEVQVQRRGAAAQRADVDGRLSGGGRCRLKLQR